MIVVGKLVHGHQEGLAVKGRRLILQGFQENLHIVQQGRIAGVAVLFHSCQVPGDRLHKGVVIHHGIPLVALEPGCRVPVMLREDHGVRIGLLDVSAEILPEFVVELFRKSQIRSHVQPPAVHVIGRGHPFAADAHDIIIKLPGILIVKLRQSLVAPPAVVIIIIGPLVGVVEFEEIPVGALLRHIGALLVIPVALIEALPVQPFVEGSAVVEHAVQQDAHAPLVDLLHEVDEKLVAGLQILLIHHALDILRGLLVVQLAGGQKLPAVIFYHCKMRIDIVVVLAVILMVGRGYENRIHIDNFHAQILQIVQLV